jgi:hypothetical protein
MTCAMLSPHLIVYTLLKAPLARNLISQTSGTPNSCHAIFAMMLMSGSMVHAGSRSPNQVSFYSRPTCKSATAEGIVSVVLVGVLTVVMCEIALMTSWLKLRCVVRIRLREYGEEENELMDERTADCWFTTQTLTTLC